MKISFQPAKISGLFLKLFLLSFPFQIQTLLYKTDWFSGQFNYFSGFFLNLSEVLLLLALFFYGYNSIVGGTFSEKHDQTTKTELFFLAGMAGMIIWTVLSVFWAGDKFLALFFSFRLLELAGLLLLIVKEVIPRDVLLKYLFWGAALQVMIGLGQYLKQGDLGLRILGEPALGGDYLNIAKIDLGGEKILRAYGTFPHANVFGGYMFVCLALLVQKLSRDNVLKNFHFLIIFLVGILISFSRSAWLAAGIFTALIFLQQVLKINFKQILLALVIGIFILAVFSLDQVILARILNFSLQSWNERLIYSDVARMIIEQNFIFGVGAGNFVATMWSYYPLSLSPWLYQPVHSFFLMIGAETGVLGLFWWLMIFGATIKMVFESMHRLVMNQKAFGKVWLALFTGLLAIAVFDHYFYTLWQGQVLIFMLLGLVILDYQKKVRELIK